MATLINYISQVMMEFGGIIPSNLLSYHDVAREFLSVYSLEMQKLGISSTNITVKYSDVNLTTREFTVTSIPGVTGDFIPAFVEFNEKNTTTPKKVEIVPLSILPTYEGARAISFFDTPLKARTAWDYWKNGTLRIYYDPIPKLETINYGDGIVFPPNFNVYLVKKTAFFLIKVIRIKTMTYQPDYPGFSLEGFINALNMFEQTLGLQLQEWQEEFRKFKNIDRNFQPRLRRSWDEIHLLDYDNVTGNIPTEKEP
jgi:hypothetical protein